MGILNLINTTGGLIYIDFCSILLLIIGIIIGIIGAKSHKKKNKKEFKYALIFIVLELCVLLFFISKIIGQILD